jgi:hypothetical protein
VARGSDIEQLMFYSIHSDSLVTLSDGSTWRVSAEAAKVASLWRQADPVEVKANPGSYDWAFRIVHLASGASAPATPSPGPRTV